MTPEQRIIQQLSDRLVKAQSPIRILDAIKWSDSIKQQFFADKFKRQPEVDLDYYAQKDPLPFNTADKRDEFNGIIRDAHSQLGQYAIITQMLERRCIDYIRAIDMLEARGTSEFSEIAMQLYGGPNDAFYAGGPKLSELGSLLGDVLHNLKQEIQSPHDDKKHPASDAVTFLQAKLKDYFGEGDKAIVKLSDDIVSDATAGSDTIKLNQQVKFSDNDLRYLEVHEGWVHIGTTFNGLKQPYCTFLAKGSPASTVTQEGLAVLTEIFTFSANPSRLHKLTHRVQTIDQVANGATFLDVFHYLLQEGYSEDDAYAMSVRVFRGSCPTLGPFTKDLSYTRGFVLIYNYLRLAVQKGLVNSIPLFFVGKIVVEEVPAIAELIKQEIITSPVYLPPQFQDLAALSSWMSLSLYLNKFNLDDLAKQYTFIPS